MAITLDTTLGGASSNSYVTLDQANLYFSEIMWSDVWNNETDDEVKKSALVTAVRRMEQEKYYGERVDTSTPQRLSFPRKGMDYLDGIDLNYIIPEQIKEAQLELAKYIMSNDITRKQTDIGGIKKQKDVVGDLTTEIEYITDEVPRVTSYNTLPDYVNSLLENFSSTSSGGWTTWGR